MDESNSKQNTKIRYMDTAGAYDLWSKVYDTDDNFLQALDTTEMKHLLPRMLSSIEHSQPWRVVDLGCGTGRNTVELLNHDEIAITALDLSPKMLDIARQRLETEAKRLGNSREVHLETFNMLNGSPIPNLAQYAHAVLSTLVIEHVPLDEYFATAAKMLRQGGILLVTNMHSDMGAISQAGFVDPVTGDKIRPQSYAHTIQDVTDIATKHGFQLLEPIEERKVTPQVAPALGPRADKWIGITVWFGGLFKKT